MSNQIGELKPDQLRDYKPPKDQPPPIINCHTHIFTADCVPPFLARTIIPSPFYRLLPLTPFVKLVRWWLGNKYSPYRLKFLPLYKKIVRGVYLTKMAFTRYFVLKVIKFFLGLLILISIFHSLYSNYLKPWLDQQGIGTKWADQADQWLMDNGILIITDNFWLKAILLIVLLLLFPSGRNLLIFLLKKFTGFFKMLPGKNTMELIQRYFTIVRFARYKRQRDILTKLLNQYPPGSSIVILPMDMEFMGAGTQKKPFHIQMEELAELKLTRSIKPFLAIDPRRTTAGNKVFLDYEISENKVELKECFVKEYMEDKEFAGFKLYPALGYFPFDKKLLPLWKYAADRGIPIMTHCIRGVIYYRGPKSKDWDFHPVFKQAMGKEKDQKDPDDNSDNDEDVSGFEPMLLSQMKAIDVQEIFTHPMNYVCLLNEHYLAQLIGISNDNELKKLFGYSKTTERKKVKVKGVETEKEVEVEAVKYNLRHLKICFGHFGGEDEWAKFFEKDRDNFSSQLVKNPEKGIDFVLGSNKQVSPGKPEQLWRSADWYSIICSLMLQHPHVYADISYILHGDLEIRSLLKHTLQHPKLKERVLFGTDFYVVRNHKSDKNMLADTMASLNDNEFKQIAITNPVNYLYRNDIT